MRWDANLARWFLAGDAEEYRLSNERRQLLLALQKAQAPMSPKEIAEATGKSHGSVKVLLGEMVRAGQVSSPSYGKYALPAASPYSAYSANPCDEEQDEGKDGKQSKGGDGTAPVTCIHGYPGGRGCYPCDLVLHPNRGGGGEHS